MLSDRNYGVLSRDCTCARRSKPKLFFLCSRLRGNFSVVQTLDRCVVVHIYASAGVKYQERLGMAVAQVRNSFAVEEEHFCRLYADVAGRLMTENNITLSEVTSSTDTLQSELSRRPWLHNSPLNIDFNNMATCCAYLKRYAACHSALARYATMKYFEESPFPTFIKLLNRNPLEIVSLGGGPGNDLIGMCSFLAERPRLFDSLGLTVVDIKSGWSEVFATSVNQITSSDYGNVSQLFEDLQVSTTFVQSDVMKQRCFNAVSNADIVLMTKFLSVIPPDRRALVLHLMYLSMKPGAVLLYVDINSELVLDVACNYSTYTLFHERLGDFRMSVDPPPGMIRRSSFDICAVQKAFTVPGDPWIEGEFWPPRRRGAYGGIFY